MKKAVSKKSLRLSSETLRALSAGEIVDVCGGAAQQTRLYNGIPLCSGGVQACSGVGCNMPAPPL